MLITNINTELGQSQKTLSKQKSELINKWYHNRLRFKNKEKYNMWDTKQRQGNNKRSERSVKRSGLL